MCAFQNKNCHETLKITVFSWHTQKKSTEKVGQSQPVSGKLKTASMAKRSWIGETKNSSDHPCPEQSDDVSLKNNKKTQIGIINQVSFTNFMRWRRTMFYS